MRKIILLVFCCALLSGCGTFLKLEKLTQTRRERSDTYKWNYFGVTYDNYKIEVISQPAGAEIEVDGTHKGVTPLILTCTGTIGINSRMTLKAYPARGKGYVQTKVILGDDVLPRKIYFDTSIKPDDQED